MWIAFIFQYLWDTKQLSTVYSTPSACCELLSFFSIFGIQNNICCRCLSSSWVVNCFHFSVSLGYKTTLENGNNTKKSCELLSFFSIFGIQNNTINSPFFCQRVVNCFHFSVSLGYKTTNFIVSIFILELWIALATPNRLAFPLLDFIFQYLWDTKQQKLLILELLYCCELLSFFSIFGIQNNCKSR